MKNKTTIYLLIHVLIIILTLSIVSCANDTAPKLVWDDREGTFINKTPEAQEESKEPEVPKEEKEVQVDGVIQLTKADFLKKVADYRDYPNNWKYLGNKPVIIDFYADWCGYCRKIAPILENLAIEYAGKIIVYKVNTDEEKELAEKFNIRSLPTLLFIPLSGNPEMKEGALSKEGLKKNIDNILLIDR